MKSSQQTVKKIMDFAQLIADQDRQKIERYTKWESHIVPLVRDKFKIKFELQYRYMVSIEVQKFIDQEEAKFLNEN